MAKGTNPIKRAKMAASVGSAGSDTSEGTAQYDPGQESDDTLKYDSEDCDRDREVEEALKLQRPHKRQHQEPVRYSPAPRRTTVAENIEKTGDPVIDEDWELLEEHGDACRKCHKAGSLVCCSWCWHGVYHERCIPPGSKDVTEEEEWACAACVASGRAAKPEEMVVDKPSIEDKRIAEPLSVDITRREKGPDGQWEYLCTFAGTQCIKFLSSLRNDSLLPAGCDEPWWAEISEQRYQKELKILKQHRRDKPAPDTRVPRPTRRRRGRNMIDLDVGGEPLQVSQKVARLYEKAGRVEFYKERAEVLTHDAVDPLDSDERDGMLLTLLEKVGEEFGRGIEAATSGASYKLKRGDLRRQNFTVHLPRCPLLFTVMIKKQLKAGEFCHQDSTKSVSFVRLYTGKRVQEVLWGSTNHAVGTGIHRYCMVLPKATLSDAFDLASVTTPEPRLNIIRRDRGIHLRVLDVHSEDNRFYLCWADRTADNDGQGEVDVLGHKLCGVLGYLPKEMLVVNPVVLSFSHETGTFCMTAERTLFNGGHVL